MSAGWPRIPIKETYIGLYDGPHATPTPAVDGPVFLGIKNITEDGRLDLSEIRHIAEDDFPKWIRRVQPQPGDIVFTYEATLNRYALIPEGFRGCLGRRLALIRPNLDVVEPKFLYYSFFGEEWRETIARNTLVGSTVDRVPLTTFPEFPIAFPPLPTQRKIASILSAYDDLIENNTRRIAILEEMAQSLYREWFVHYRYPGHEHVPLVDSPIGPVPEGWEVRTIGEIADFISRGISPKYDATSDQLVINQRCIRDGKLSLDVARGHSSKVADDKYVRLGDVLINSTGVGTLGRVAQIYEHIRNCTTDSHVTIVRPSVRIDRDFFGLALMWRQPIFEALGVGATGQTELSRQRISEVDITVSPHDLQSQFGQMVSPQRRLAMQLQRQNAVLRAARDFLLPRLISGDVCVAKHSLA